MTSEARIAASRENGRKSRGPISAQGRAISAMNALRHGRRSKRIALVDDISCSYEERRRKWMASRDASNDVEEFLISRCATMASKLERIERADAERFRSAIEKADEKEHEEVLALGKCLFFNRCGSVGTYGLKPAFALKVKTSFSGLPLEPEEPFAIVGKLISTELGTRFLLDTWDGLRGQLEPGKFWQAPDRFQATRLLAHQPIDARFDEEIAAIFYASANSSRGSRSRSVNCAAILMRISFWSCESRWPNGIPSWRRSRIGPSADRSCSTSSIGISNSLKRS